MKKRNFVDGEPGKTPQTDFAPPDGTSVLTGPENATAGEKTASDGKSDPAFTYDFEADLLRRNARRALRLMEDERWRKVCRAQGSELAWDSVLAGLRTLAGK